jgi:hypothetical protein
MHQVTATAAEEVERPRGAGLRVQGRWEFPKDADGDFYEVIFA